VVIFEPWSHYHRPDVPDFVDISTTNLDFNSSSGDARRHEIQVYIELPNNAGEENIISGARSSSSAS
jgi:hypothetical protein